MSLPTWTINVATIAERTHSFGRLMTQLLPQTQPYDGAVRVAAWWNNGSPHLTEIRQGMNERAETDYVSCIDDDDLVAPDYVDTIMEALIADRPDYVGFLVQCYSDGVPTAISVHSLENKGWWNEETRYFRDFSHLNPIRRQLALRADFRKARKGEAEDRAWVAQMRKHRFGMHQAMIDRILYHYLFSTSQTAGIGSRWRAGPREHSMLRAEIDHPHFTYLEA